MGEHWHLQPSGVNKPSDANVYCKNNGYMKKKGRCKKEKYGGKQTEMNTKI